MPLGPAGGAAGVLCGSLVHGFLLLSLVFRPPQLPPAPLELLLAHSSSSSHSLASWVKAEVRDTWKKELGKPHKGPASSPESALSQGTNSTQRALFNLFSSTQTLSSSTKTDTNVRLLQPPSGPKTVSSRGPRQRQVTGQDWQAPAPISKGHWNPPPLPGAGAWRTHSGSSRTPPVGGDLLSQRNGPRTGEVAPALLRP